MINRKILSLGLLITVLALLGSWLALTGYNPFKVIDPSDPRFDPNQFSIENYSSEVELQSALVALFPRGTSREYVEVILIEKGDLQAGFTAGDDGAYFVTYRPRGKELPSFVGSRFFGNGLHQTQVKFSLNDKVMSIKSHIIDGKRPPTFFAGEPIEIGEKR